MTQPAQAFARPGGKPPVRVMLVDDSAVVRGLIRRFIDPVPDIEVMTTAANGEAAVVTLKRNPVDVIVLDIEMPVMDGLTAIPLLLETQPDVKIIMASTLTEKNADISLRAIKAGASDYLPKPSSGTGLGNAEDFRRELIEKICALGRRSTAPRVEPAVAPAQPFRRKQSIDTKPLAVAIGSSTGGPQALTRVLSDIDAKMKLPIFITQHMPATFTSLLCEHLTRDSGREVVEGVDGMPVVPGKAYLAPGDYHMLITGKPERPVLRLDQSEKVNFCRPAVDTMLDSVIACYGANVLAVILTGMGHDGLKGCERVVAARGMVIAQDEKTSVVWGMPGAVARAGICEDILAVGEMGKAINRLTRAIP